MAAPAMLLPTAAIWNRGGHDSLLRVCLCTYGRYLFDSTRIELVQDLPVWGSLLQPMNVAEMLRGRENSLQVLCKHTMQFPISVFIPTQQPVDKCFLCDGLSLPTPRENLRKIASSKQAEQ